MVACEAASSPCPRVALISAATAASRTSPTRGWRGSLRPRDWSEACETSVAAVPVVRPGRACPGRLVGAPRAYVRYLRERRRYRHLPGAELLSWGDDYPQLWDRVPSSPYDSHYFFQDVWAAQRIAMLQPAEHVDVGSRVDLVGFLTALTAVVFVDIRPLEVELPGLTSVAGSVLDLPFADRSITSLSCLHVAEHVGLLAATGIRWTRTEHSRPLRSSSEFLRQVVSSSSRCPSAGPASSSTPIGFLPLPRSSAPSQSLNSQSSAASMMEVTSRVIDSSTSLQAPTMRAGCSGSGVSSDATARRLRRARPQRRSRRNERRRCAL